MNDPKGGSARRRGDSSPKHQSRRSIPRFTQRSIQAEEGFIRVTNPSVRKTRGSSVSALYARERSSGGDSYRHFSSNGAQSHSRSSQRRESKHHSRNSSFQKKASHDRNQSTLDSFASESGNSSHSNGRTISPSVLPTSVVANSMIEQIRNITKRLSEVTSELSPNAYPIATRDVLTAVSLGQYQAARQQGTSAALPHHEIEDCRHSQCPCCDGVLGHLAYLLFTNPTFDHSRWVELKNILQGQRPIESPPGCPNVQGALKELVRVCRDLMDTTVPISEMEEMERRLKTADAEVLNLQNQINKLQELLDQARSESSWHRGGASEDLSAHSMKTTSIVAWLDLATSNPVSDTESVGVRPHTDSSSSQADYVVETDLRSKIAALIADKEAELADLRRGAVTWASKRTLILNKQAEIEKLHRVLLNEFAGVNDAVEDGTITASLKSQPSPAEKLIDHIELLRQDINVFVQSFETTDIELIVPNLQDLSAAVTQTLARFRRETPTSATKLEAGSDVKPDTLSDYLRYQQLKSGQDDELLRVVDNILASSASSPRPRHVLLKELFDYQEKQLQAKSAENGALKREIDLLRQESTNNKEALQILCESQVLLLERVDALTGGEKGLIDDFTDFLLQLRQHQGNENVEVHLQRLDRWNEVLTQRLNAWSSSIVAENATALKEKEEEVVHLLSQLEEDRALIRRYSAEGTELHNEIQKLQKSASAVTMKSKKYKRSDEGKAPHKTGAAEETPLLEAFEEPTLFNPAIPPALEKVLSVESDEFQPFEKAAAAAAPAAALEAKLKEGSAVSSNLQSKMDEQADRISRLEARLCAQTEEFQSKLTEASEMSSQFIVIKEAYETELQQLRSMLRQKTAEVSSLQSSLESSQQEIATLKNRIRELKTECINLQEASEKAHAATTAQSIEVENLRGALNKKTQELSDMREPLQEHKTLLQNLRFVLHNKDNDIAERDKKIEAISRKLTESRAENETVRHEFEQLSSLFDRFWMSTLLIDESTGQTKTGSILERNEPLTLLKTSSGVEQFLRLLLCKEPETEIGDLQACIRAYKVFRESTKDQSTDDTSVIVKNYHELPWNPCCVTAVSAVAAIQGDARLFNILRDLAFSESCRVRLANQLSESKAQVDQLKETLGALQSEVESNHTQLAERTRQLILLGINPDDSTAATASSADNTTVCYVDTEEVVQPQAVNSGLLTTPTDDSLQKRLEVLEAENATKIKQIEVTRQKLIDTEKCLMEAHAAKSEVLQKLAQVEEKLRNVQVATSEHLTIKSSVIDDDVIQCFADILNTEANSQAIRKRIEAMKEELLDNKAEKGRLQHQLYRVRDQLEKASSGISRQHEERISELKSQNEALLAAADQIQVEMEKRRSIEQLVQSLENSLRAKAEEQKAQENKHRQEAAASAQELENLQTKLKVLHAEVASKVEKCNALENEVLSLTQRLNEAQSKEPVQEIIEPTLVEAMRGKPPLTSGPAFTTSSLEVESYKKDVVALKLEAEKQNSCISRLESRNSKLTEALAESEAALVASEGTIKELEGSMHDLKCLPTFGEGPNIGEILHEYLGVEQPTLSSPRADVNEPTARLKALNERISAISSKPHESWSGLCDRFEVDVADLLKEQVDLKMRVAELEYEIKESSIKYDEMLEARMASALEVQKQLEAALRLMENEQVSLEEKTQQMLAEKQEASSTQIEELQLQLRSLEENRATKEAELEELIATLRAAQDENRFLRGLLGGQNVYEEDVEDLKQALEAHTADNEKILREKTKLIEQLAQQVQSLEDDNQRKAVDCVAMSQQIESLKSELKAAKARESVLLSLSPSSFLEPPASFEVVQTETLFTAPPSAMTDAGQKSKADEDSLSLEDKSELVALRSEVEEQVSRISSLEEDLRGKEVVLETSEKALHDQKELLDLKSKVEERDRIILSLQRSEKSLKQDLSTKEKSLQEALDALEAGKQELNLMENKLKLALEDSQQARLLRQKLKDVEAEFASMKVEYESMNSKLEASSKQLEEQPIIEPTMGVPEMAEPVLTATLPKDLYDSDELVPRLSSLVEQLSTTSNRLPETCQELLDNLENEVSSLVKDRAYLKSQLAKQEMKFSLLLDEVANCQRELAQRNASLSALEASLIRLLARLNSQSKDLESALSTGEDKVYELITMLEAANAREIELRGQLEDGESLGRQLQEMVTRTSHLTQDLERAIFARNALAQELKLKRDEKEALQKAVEVMKADRQALEDTLRAKEEEQKVLNDALKATEEAKAHFEVILTAKEYEKSILEDTLKNMENEHKALQGKLEFALASAASKDTEMGLRMLQDANLREEYVRQELAAKSSHGELKQIGKLLNLAESERTTLEDSLKALQNESRRLQVKHESTERELAKCLQDLQTEHGQKVAECTTLRSEIADLKQLMSVKKLPVIEESTTPILESVLGVQSTALVTARGDVETTSHKPISELEEPRMVEDQLQALHAGNKSVNSALQSDECEAKSPQNQVQHLSSSTAALAELEILLQESEAMKADNSKKARQIEDLNQALSVAEARVALLMSMAPEESFELVNVETDTSETPVFPHAEIGEDHVQLLKEELENQAIRVAEIESKNQKLLDALKSKEAEVLVLQRSTQDLKEFLDCERNEKVLLQASLKAKGDELEKLETKLSEIETLSRSKVTECQILSDEVAPLTQQVNELMVEETAQPPSTSATKFTGFQSSDEALTTRLLSLLKMVTDEACSNQESWSDLLSRVEVGVSDLLDNRADLNSKLNNLEVEIQALSAEVSEKEANAQRLVSKVSDFTEAMAKRDVDLAKVETRIEEVSASLVSQLNALMVAVRSGEDRVTELMNLLDEANMREVELQGRVVKATDREEKLKKELSGKHRYLIKLSSDFKTQCSDNMELSKRCDQMTETLSHIEAEKDQLEELLCTKEVEVASLRKQLEATTLQPIVESGMLEKVVTEPTLSVPHEEECTKQHGMEDSMIARLSALLEQMSEISGLQPQTSYSWSELMNFVEESVADLLNDRASLKVAINDLLNETKYKDDRLERLSIEVAQQQEALLKREMWLGGLEAKMTELSDLLLVQLEDLTRALTAGEGRMSELMTMLESAQAVESNLRDNLAEISAREQTIIEDLSAERGQKSVLEGEKLKSVKVLHDKESELASLKSTLKSINEKKVVEEELAQKTSGLKAAQEKQAVGVGDLRSRLMELEDECVAMRGETERLRNELNVTRAREQCLLSMAPSLDPLAPELVTVVTQQQTGTKAFPSEAVEGDLNQLVKTGPVLSALQTKSYADGKTPIDRSLMSRLSTLAEQVSPGKEADAPESFLDLVEAGVFDLLRARVDMQTKVDDLEAEIQNLTDRLSGYEDELKKRDSDLTNMETEIEDLSTRLLSQLNNSMSAVSCGEGRIYELISMLEDANARENALQAKIEEASEREQQLVEELKQQKSDSSKQSSGEKELMKKCDQLSLDLASRDAELHEALKSRDVIAVELEELQKDLKNLKADNVSKSTELESLSREFGAVKARETLFLSMTQEPVSELPTMSRFVRDSLTESIDVTSGIDMDSDHRHLDDNLTLQNALEEKEIELNTLHNVLDSKEKELRCMEEDRKSLQSRLKDILNLNARSQESVVAELEALRQKAISLEAESAQKTEECSDLNEEIETLKHDLSVATARLSLLMSMTSEVVEPLVVKVGKAETLLTSQPKEAHVQSDCEIVKLKEKVEMQASKLVGLEELNRKLEKSLKGKTTEVGELESSLSTKELDLNALEDALKMKDDEIGTLEAKIFQLTSAVAEVGALRESLPALKEELEAKTTECNTLSAKLASVTRELNTSKVAGLYLPEIEPARAPLIYEGKPEGLNDIMKRLIVLAGEVSRGSMVPTSLLEAMDQVEQGVSGLLNSQANLEAEFQALKGRLADAETDIIQLTEEVNEQQKELLIRDASLDSLEASVTSLSSGLDRQFNDLHNAVDAIVKREDELKVLLEASNETNQVNSDEAMCRERKLREEIAKMVKENERLKSQKTEIETHHECFELKDNECKKPEEDHAELRMMKHLEQSVNEKEAKNNALEQTLHPLEAEGIAAQKDLQMTTAKSTQVVKLAKQLVEHNESERSQSAEVDSLKQKLDSVKTQKVDLEGIIKSMEPECSIATSKLHELEKQLSTLGDSKQLQSNELGISTKELKAGEAVLMSFSQDATVEPVVVETVYSQTVMSTPEPDQSRSSAHYEAEIATLKQDISKLEEANRQLEEDLSSKASEWLALETDLESTVRQKEDELSVLRSAMQRILQDSQEPEARLSNLFDHLECGHANDLIKSRKQSVSSEDRIREHISCSVRVAETAVSELKASRKNLQELLDENACMANELQDLQKKFVTSAEQIQVKLNALEETNVAKPKELKSLTQKLEAAKAREAVLGSLTSETRVEPIAVDCVDTESKEIGQTKISGSYEAEITTLKKEISKLQGINDELVRILKTKVDELNYAQKLTIEPTTLEPVSTEQLMSAPEVEQSHSSGHCEADIDKLKDSDDSKMDIASIKDDVAKLTDALRSQEAGYLAQRIDLESALKHAGDEFNTAEVREALFVSTASEPCFEPAAISQSPMTAPEITQSLTESHYEAEIVKLKEGISKLQEAKSELEAALNTRANEYLAQQNYLKSALKQKEDELCIAKAREALLMSLTSEPNVESVFVETVSTEPVMASPGLDHEDEINNLKEEIKQLEEANIKLQESLSSKADAQLQLEDDEEDELCALHKAVRQALEDSRRSVLITTTTLESCSIDYEPMPEVKCDSFNTAISLRLDFMNSASRAIAKELVSAQMKLKDLENDNVRLMAALGAGLTGPSVDENLLVARLVTLTDQVSTASNLQSEARDSWLALMDQTEAGVADLLRDQEDMKLKLDQQEARLANYETELQKRGTELANLETQMSTASIKLLDQTNELRDSVKRSEDRIIELLAILDEMNSREAETSSELDKVLLRESQLLYEMECLKSKAVKLASDLLSVSAKMEASENAKKSLENALNMKDDEQKTLEDALKAREIQHKSLEKTLKAKDQELKELEDRLNRHLGSSISEIEALRQRVKELEVMNENKNAECHALNTEVESLSKQLSVDSAKTTVESAIVEPSVVQLTSALPLLTATPETGSDFSSQHDELRRKAAEQELLIEGMQLVNSELKSALDAKDEEMSKLTTALKTSEEEKETLGDLLKMKDSEVRSMRDRLDQLTIASSHDSESASSEINCLQRQLQSRDEELADLNSQLEKLKKASFPTSQPQNHHKDYCPAYLSPFHINILEKVMLLIQFVQEALSTMNIPATFTEFPIFAAPVSALTKQLSALLAEIRFASQATALASSAMDVVADPEQGIASPFCVPQFKLGCLPTSSAFAFARDLGECDPSYTAQSLLSVAVCMHSQLENLLLQVAGSQKTTNLRSAWLNFFDILRDTCVLTQPRAKTSHIPSVKVVPCVCSLAPDEAMEVIKIQFALKPFLSTPPLPKIHVSKLGMLNQNRSQSAPNLRLSEQTLEDDEHLQRGIVIKSLDTFLARLCMYTSGYRKSSPFPMAALSDQLSRLRLWLVDETKLEPVVTTMNEELAKTAPRKSLELPSTELHLRRLLNIRDTEVLFLLNHLPGGEQLVDRSSMSNVLPSADCTEAQLRLMANWDMVHPIDPSCLPVYRVKLPEAAVIPLLTGSETKEQSSSIKLSQSRKSITDSETSLTSLSSKSVDEVKALLRRCWNLLKVMVATFKRSSKPKTLSSHANELLDTSLRLSRLLNGEDGVVGTLLPEQQLGEFQKIPESPNEPKAFSRAPIQELIWAIENVEDMEELRSLALFLTQQYNAIATTLEQQLKVNRDLRGRLREANNHIARIYLGISQGSQRLAVMTERLLVEAQKQEDMSSAVEEVVSTRTEESQKPQAESELADSSVKTSTEPAASSSARKAERQKPSVLLRHIRHAMKPKSKK